jgi:group I intron endonuclease
MIGIYKITNPIGEIYIGQAVDIEKRWQQHRYESNWNYYKLYNSFRKYGVDQHTFEVQKPCLREELNRLERHYQEKFDTVQNGLNHLYQEADEKPKILSEETKRKISKANKGKKRTPHTEEHKRKISEAMKGEKLSEEHKRRISETKKGKPSGMKGKIMTEEHKRKISEAHKGKSFSEETKRKMSKAKKNMTDKTKRKMSEARKGRKLSEETKRKMREAQKRRRRREKL